MPINLISFDPHSLIWETLKAKFFEMFEGSPGSSSKKISHFKRWDKSCLCRSYHTNNVFDKLKTCHLISASIFFPNDCPFLLGAIMDNNSSPIPFQTHLRWVHDLLPPTCRNPSLGFTTKARVCKGVGQERAWESHFMLLGMQESVKEWTLTLPSELPFWEFESQWTPESAEINFRGQNSLDWRVPCIIKKLLEHRCLKWTCMTYLGT